MKRGVAAADFKTEEIRTTHASLSFLLLLLLLLLGKLCASVKKERKGAKEEREREKREKVNRTDALFPPLPHKLSLPLKC